MARVDEAVRAAIDRWERRGLLTPELAGTLRRDVSEHAHRSSRHGAQYALAVTAGVILLIAAGLLADWLWPMMDAAGQSVTLGLTGVAIHLLGRQLRGGPRWKAASYLLQITGLTILLGAYAFSEQAWADSTPGGLFVGVLALATPLAASPRGLLRKDPVMPAANLALGLAFLAVFMSRSLDMPGDRITWVLDGVLAVLAALLVRALRREPGASDWALNAFVAALYAGLVLVVLTATGPLGLEQNVIYPIDAWWLGMVGLTLWGIHRAPPALQRAWYELQLGWLVVLAIPLALITTDSVMGAPEEVGAILLALLGGLGLRYAIGQDARATLGASCLALLSAAWYYGVSRGGALGAVLALAASAALLFWVSSRVGWRVEAGS